jgi:hypothetical protein
MTAEVERREVVPMITETNAELAAHIAEPIAVRTWSR